MYPILFKSTAITNWSDGFKICPTTFVVGWVYIMWQLLRPNYVSQCKTEIHKSTVMDVNAQIRIAPHSRPAHQSRCPRMRPLGDEHHLEPLRPRCFGGF